ncbi:hypothetical protein ACOMHN_018598 [Nucella lapillus]
MQATTSTPQDRTFSGISFDTTTTTDSSSFSDDDDDNGRSYNVTTPGGTVHDIDYDFNVRKIVLYVQILVGVLGGVLVLVWMFSNRRLRTRVNAFIVNLCVADLMVMFFGCTFQLVWEYTAREWLAGDFMCRLMKFLMIFSNIASTNMLVVIAIDRHQAIRAPLREPFAPVETLRFKGHSVLSTDQFQ